MPLVPFGTGYPRKNFLPNFWGKPSWTFLHTIAAAYPDRPTLEDARRMRQTLENLGWQLPCERCRMHWGDGVKGLSDYDLRSSYHLQRWLVARHNEVNQRYGRDPVPEKDAMKTYLQGDFEEKIPKIDETFSKEGWLKIAGAKSQCQASSASGAYTAGAVALGFLAAGLLVAYYLRASSRQDNRQKR